MFRKIYSVVTIGGATRDIMFYTTAGSLISNGQADLPQNLIGFEYGAKIMPSSTHFVFGGGGCNTAVGFARLGLKTAAFVRVGSDKDGKIIETELADENITTKYIEYDQKLSTGFSFFVIDEKTKEHVAFLYRGANDNMKMTQTELERARTKWFYVSSLSDRHWQVTAHNLIDYLKSHKKTRLAWNPGETQLKRGRHGLASLFRLTQVLFLNKSEAIELVRSSHGSIGQIHQPWPLLKAIQSWGPKIVAITDAERGAYVFDGQNRYHEKAVKVKVVDTTGAGDAFSSTFVAGIILFKNNVRRALRLAMINSSSVVSVIGAQPGLLSRSSILERARKIYKKDW
ncbi:MAG: carbohydrate kinase family protein [Patescibacteria group bacterium]|nr:carbohydrate kinase family protein [Patescibacteria group bacterium]